MALSMFEVILSYYNLSHRKVVIRNSFRPVIIRQKCLQMIPDLQSMFVNSRNLLGSHLCADRPGYLKTKIYIEIS